MVVIGVGDKILVEFSTFGDRFLGVVTDVKADGRLIVYVSVPSSVSRRIRTDPNAFVRFADEGMLCGFKTRVLNPVDASDMLFELAEPSDVLDAEDRCEPRCACRFPAMVVEGSQAAKAIVEDMSKSCSRVRFLNGDLDSFGQGIDNEVLLTFHPFDMSEGYSVGCHVRNSFIKDGQQYAVLEFNSNEKDACGRIARFVEAQVCCGFPRIEI